VQDYVSLGNAATTKVFATTWGVGVFVGVFVLMPMVVLVLAPTPTDTVRLAPTS